MTQRNHAKTYECSHPFWIDFVAAAIAIGVADATEEAIAITVAEEAIIIAAGLEVTQVLDSSWKLFE